jgi:exopolysaccharide production protein ExoY
MTFASSPLSQNLIDTQSPEPIDQVLSYGISSDDQVVISPKFVASIPNARICSTENKNSHKNSHCLKRGSRRSRGIDVILAATALIILFPAFLLIALMIWLHDRGPPVFAHRRIGKEGKTFPCLKFRTMVMDAEQRLADILRSDPDAAEEWERNQKLLIDPRITPIGNFLRKTSLDEVPQLFNVLIGQMSMVGPRPIVENEIPRYGRYFEHYCRVRPGITGLWQVSGRNDVSYRRRVVMDTVYCRSKSVALDLSILTLTVPAVLKQRGAA